jgi:hypothetical protein
MEYLFVFSRLREKKEPGAQQRGDEGTSGFHLALTYPTASRRAPFLSHAAGEDFAGVF